MTSSTLSKLWL